MDSLFSCGETNLARKAPSKNNVNILKDLLALLSNAAATAISEYQNSQNVSGAGSQLTFIKRTPDEGQYTY